MTAQQLRDTTIAIVNGKPVTLGTMINDLRLTGKSPVRSTSQTDPIHSAIQNMLVSGMAEREGISVSDAELQEAADKFRQTMRLYSPEDTMNWLENGGLTVNDLERILERDLLVDKLKQHLITDDLIETFYSVNKPAFEWAHLSQIVVNDESRANALYQRLTDTDADFDELARTDSDSEGESCEIGGYLGIVNREELIPEVGNAVLSAAPGSIVGPLKTDQGYHLIKVWDLSKDRFSAQGRERIRELLFWEWIDDQASCADVELLI
jgi:parvulin-like peptidyl-prolyl isomerase